MTKKVRSCAVLLVLVIHSCAGFYLPGLAPVNYCPKDAETDTCKVCFCIIFSVVCLTRTWQMSVTMYGRKRLIIARSKMCNEPCYERQI